MNAIVIDDSRAMRGILKRILLGMQFKVQEAPDGQDAMERLTADPAVPDLALVDWNMPRMTGIEFVRAVRPVPRFAAMQIVMVTTEVETAQMALALEAGANEYVMKPFTEDSMREKLMLLGFSGEAVGAEAA